MLKKVRCNEHNQIVAERIEPCREYPYGAVKLVDKHHGKPCETIISFSKPADDKLNP